MHLESKPFTLPEVVDGNSSPGGQEGTVRAPFEEGSVFLKNEEGKVLRVCWESRVGVAPGKFRTRKVPTGVYSVIGYRAIRKDSSGATWLISALGETSPPVQIRAEQETKIPVSDTIFVSCQLRPRGQVGMMFAGEGRSGLTVYKNWKRIPVDFKITGPTGEELASGRIAYG